jgi:KamA family protein
VLSDVDIPAPRGPAAQAPRYRALGPQQLDRIAARYGLAGDQTATVRLHARVLPFRVNDYVLEHLIDWSNIPDDPIFQLVFPQPGMLPDADVTRVARAAEQGPAADLQQVVSEVRAGLNPHPGGQLEHNVPEHLGSRLQGVQHKYAETALYFPAQGQTCHAYCTYCFRWAQFVGDQDLRFAAVDPGPFVAYLRQHPEVHDVLVTGGDPMIMSTARLRGHIEAILSVPSVRTIRIGTKSLAYWPARYTTDPDAEDLLRLLEQVVATRRSVAVMAHFSHPRELSTATVQAALGRIRATGAVIYAQAPLMAHVNDDPAVWAQLWRAELAAGVVPYYMFLARDTGPQAYFEVPIARGWRIFTDAYRTLPGLARTVRGPVMSTTAGKVIIDGVTGHGPDHRFVLRFLQARNPALVGRPFHARYTPTAAWLDQLTIPTAEPDDIRQHIAHAAGAPYLHTTEGPALAPGAG